MSFMTEPQKSLVPSATFYPLEARNLGLSWGSSGEDSMLPLHGAQTGLVPAQGAKILQAAWHGHKKKMKPRT